MPEHKLNKRKELVGIMAEYGVSVPMTGIRDRFWESLRDTLGGVVTIRTAGLREAGDWPEDRLYDFRKAPEAQAAELKWIPLLRLGQPERRRDARLDPGMKQGRFRPHRGLETPLF